MKAETHKGTRDNTIDSKMFGLWEFSPFLTHPKLKKSGCGLHP